MINKELHDAIDKLPEDKKEEVKDFVDFLRQRQEAKKVLYPGKGSLGYVKGFFQNEGGF